MANAEEFDIEENIINGELSFDVSEEDLLKELELLSPNTNQPSATIKPTNCEYLSDYNVEDENIILTPDDENNPELLAELNALTFKEPEIAADPIKELKKEILELKRKGDLEGAKAKLKELTSFEKPRTEEPLTKITFTSAKITEEPIVTNFTANFTGANSPKIVSTDTQIYRDLFSKLQKQSTTCQTISEFYAAVNRKSDANLFIKRKQALDLELQKLRLMLKNKQPAPPFKSVNVTYEYVLSNPEISEGHLQVTLGQLKVILPRKFKLKDEEEYKIKVNYEIFGLNEQEINLASEPFTVKGLSINTMKPLMIKCNKKDLRMIKSVEYKKMRIEIVGERGFIFFKSEVIKLTGQCKLDRLLKDCTFKEEVNLFDVEDGKKSAIPSAQITLTAKIRSPLTSDGFKQSTEKWTVIPSFGFSNQTLYSDLSPLLVQSSLKNNPPNVTGTFADNIKSFEVIEYELAQLNQNQNDVLNDAKLMDLQVALESLRDRIQIQVELGQISLEDYLNSVKECINETKKLALEAKRSGDLPLAQKCVKHVDIMRKEVAEAEANVAAEINED